MENNIFDNGLYSFKANFMGFPGPGGSSTSNTGLPRPSLGFPPMVCDSFEMLDSSFAILDLSALDFGRDSIAIYDIKSARNKTENQSKDFQKDMFEICDRSLHQLPILFPKEDKSVDTIETIQEQPFHNNLDSSFKLTSKNTFNISYSTKSSIEELETVKNSVRASFSSVANLDSVFAPERTIKSLQNSPANTSFDKERYLLDFVPQPDFDEFNLSNEHHKTYLFDKDPSPKLINKLESEIYTKSRANTTQICKACQCDILQENNNNLNPTIYTEDDIRKSIKLLSESLNQKANLSKVVLEKSQKMLKELDNVLTGYNVIPTEKKLTNNSGDKEQKSATKRSSTVATPSDNKITENREIVKQVKATVTKNKPLRATVPVEKMSKIKALNQPQQSTGQVTPDKSVDSLSKLNKTITPVHENKRASTPTSTPFSRLPKTTKPLFYSPPARKQVLKPCNSSSIKTDERPVLSKNHSFDGNTVVPKLKSGFSNVKTFSGLSKTRLLDLPSYRNSTGSTNTVQSRRASKENLKPFY